jgi:7,8-dihydropterin-6-yl-methyl-4-(beta-D-ribofuranosyl)aminobenzene 5'-phosphate synthase
VELAGDKTPLHAVLGGFHLGTSVAEDIQQTVQDLKELDPKILLPGHCTGWRAKFEIEKQMPGRLVPCIVGTKYTF